MNMGLNGSSFFASTFAIGLWTRPWKSIAMPKSLPQASRISCTRARTASTLSLVSIICSSSVAFILTALKPASIFSFAARPVSPGRSPPIHEYTFMRSRHRPPISS